MGEVANEPNETEWGCGGQGDHGGGASAMDGEGMAGRSPVG